MILTLDIGGTEIKYAAIENEITFQDKTSTSIIQSEESFYDTITSIYHKFENVEGIAISMPGIINSETGYIELVSVFPYLSKTNVKEGLEKRLHIPVSVENDAKSAALCEAKIGGAKGVNDAIVIVFGTGIGGSIIKDHKIHHGSHLLSGEVSTIIVDKNGTEWANICATSRVCKKVANALGRDKINGIEMYQLVRENNQIVIDILEELYFNIAIQLYNFQYIFDPAIILIGGGISKEPLFIDGIQRAIDTLKEGKIIVPKIDTCKYYNDANLYGAYYHFLDQHKA